MKHFISVPKIEFYLSVLHKVLHKVPDSPFPLPAAQLLIQIENMKWYMAEQRKSSEKCEQNRPNAETHCVSKALSNRNHRFAGQKKTQHQLKALTRLNL